MSGENAEKAIHGSLTLCKYGRLKLKILHEGPLLYFFVFSFSSHEKSHINILNKLYAFNNCCFVDHSIIVLRAEKVEDILKLQLIF